MTQDIALLIIDAQTAMFDPAEPVHEASALLETLRALSERARAAGVPVIFVQHTGAEGGPFHPSAPGWPIHPLIAPLAGETVVHKRHPDAFQETSLREELERRGIRRLIVAGAQTEFCVDTTCRRAYSLGNAVTLVEDGHSTWDNATLAAEQIIRHHNATLGGWFCAVKPAAEVDFTAG